MLKPAQTIAGVLSVLSLSLVCPAAHAGGPIEAPEEVVFTCEELEEIKAAAIQYYKEKQPERWEFLVEDLQDSGLFLKEELPQYRPASIGFWQIEQDRAVKLVRVSMDSIALRHGLNLARQDGKWLVTGNFTLEIRWQGMGSGKGLLDEASPNYQAQNAVPQGPPSVALDFNPASYTHLGFVLEVFCLEPGGRADS